MCEMAGGLTYLKGLIDMKLFAGYDGGGTKTACVLCDETGKLLGTGIGGPSNYLYCGKEMAAESVREATRQAFASAGLEPCTLEAAYMASAAILLQHGDSHVPFFSTCMDAKTVLCESDLYPIWFASTREEPAVVSIAGTGAVTYVCSLDGFIRTSGWGPLLGDEGSGYDLGLRALRLVCRMADKRAEMDEEFVNAILERLEVSVPRELIGAVNRGDSRSKVASAAYTVSQLYTKGNETAKKLLEVSAEEIALAVNTVASQRASHEPIPLVLNGSLVEPGRPLYQLLEEKLVRPGSCISRICAPDVHPAVASAALAMHNCGYDVGAEALLSGAKEVLR